MWLCRAEGGSGWKARAWGACEAHVAMPGGKGEADGGRAAWSTCEAHVAMPSKKEEADMAGARSTYLVKVGPIPDNQWSMISDEASNA
eukprot:362322-Chlamydomonas_euryale.AAC.10